MRWGRLTAAVAAVVGAVVVALVVMHGGGVAGVRAQVASAGAWAPVLFVLLQAVVTITPLPRTVFTVAAGVLFGTVWGLVLTITATVLAAMAAYVLVRWVGEALVERHAHRPGYVWVRARLDHSGLLAMVSLRLLPMMPFWMLNYASGLARVRVFPYLVGTVFGVLPGTVAIVVLGDAVTGGHVHPAMFVVSVLGAVVGLAGTAIAARRSPAVPPTDPVVDPA
ncbi:MAG TPA: TVP38/TMEM64 family protein [Pseudonocardia sp.]